MIPIIYYAHSMRLYNTPQEQEEVNRLQDAFPAGLIYNPNRVYIQHSNNPMGLCLSVVQDPGVTGLAFSHILLRIPSGVYAEIMTAQKYQKKLYMINRTTIDPYHGIIKLTKRDRATDWAMV